MRSMLIHLCPRHTHTSLPRPPTRSPIRLLPSHLLLSSSIKLPTSNPQTHPYPYLKKSVSRTLRHLWVCRRPAHLHLGRTSLLLRLADLLNRAHPRNLLGQILHGLMTMGTMGASHHCAGGTNISVAVVKGLTVEVMSRY